MTISDSRLAGGEIWGAKAWVRKNCQMDISLWKKTGFRLLVRELSKWQDPRRAGGEQDDPTSFMLFLRRSFFLWRTEVKINV